MSEYSPLGFLALNTYTTQLYYQNFQGLLKNKFYYNMHYV
jgi:hypothetical protein